MDESAMLTRKDFDVISSDVPEIIFPPETCPDVIKVFAQKGKLSNPDFYKNDFTSILINSGIFNVRIKLIANCEEVAVLNNDDLGTFYPKGYWSQANKNSTCIE